MILNKMKIGQLLTGLAVVAIAFGASAFNTTLNFKHSDVEEFLVNKEGEFEPRGSVDIQLNCEPAATTHCVFNVTPDGMLNIPEQSTYSATEIQAFEANGWITPHPDSANGNYQG